MGIAVALVLAVVVCGEHDPAVARLNDNQGAFKRKMMPRVGEVVTVTGRLSVGKISDFVWTDDPGAVYVQAKPADAAQKLSELYRGRRIAVTGRLKFAEKVVPKNPDGSVDIGVSIIPEHFYIDIADATIRAAGYER